MKILKTIAGSLIIALTINFLLYQFGFITFGTIGIGMVFENFINIPSSIIVLIINMVVILISFLINEKNSYKYLLPSLLVPIFMFATSYIEYTIELPETILAMVVSIVLLGFGYTLIYQSGYKAGTVLLLEEDLGDITKIHTQLYSTIVDILIIFIFLTMHSLQFALYSMFLMVGVRLIVNRARYNINDSKMFYVITSKEKEVKDYIIRTLGYELTELDVKGGFTKQKKSIILSVISAKDYYKLKTGIIKIDEKAFVAITDTYDVVNRKAF